jgi:outer membrane lipoprotein-sorting protein
MKHTLTVLAFALSTLVALAATAQEKLTADEILGRMDKKVNGHEDQEMDVTLTVVDTDGSEKSYTFNIKQKGNDKRLIRFNSGELKGMSILTEDQNRVHVYLPGYKKVRRVASHNMNQSFVGSDFTNADMAAASFPVLYNSTIEKEDGDHWYLKLVPKQPEESAYGHLIMKIGKKDYLQWQTDYYNPKGEHIKQFKASKPHKFPGVQDEWHTHIEISDPRTGHRTVMEVNSLQLNQGLKKKIFTTRYLQWSK